MAIAKILKLDRNEGFGNQRLQPMVDALNSNYKYIIIK